MQELKYRASRKAAPVSPAFLTKPALSNIDGTEERQVLLGESLSDVDIGYLPRTIEEIQAGIEAPLNAPNSNTQANFDYETPSQLSSEHLDPEDRIFDSSSISESLVDSDSEESQDATTPAHHLLRDLQQNLEEIGVNVVELTQSLPRHRASSQVSTVSGQLDTIIARLDITLQNRNLYTQQVTPTRAMEYLSNHNATLRQEDDRQLFRRLRPLLQQKRELLNGLASNSRIAAIDEAISNIINHRGRSDPVNGAPLPSFHERMISLRDSIRQRPTNDTQIAPISNVLSSESSRSEQHVGSAQAQIPSRSQAGTPSQVAVTPYRSTGSLGNLMGIDRSSSENLDAGNPAHRNPFSRSASVRTSEQTERQPNQLRFIHRSSSDYQSSLDSHHARTSSGRPSAEYDNGASLHNIDAYVHDQPSELGVQRTRRQPVTSGIPRTRTLPTVRSQTRPNLQTNTRHQSPSNDQHRPLPSTLGLPPTLEPLNRSGSHPALNSILDVPFARRSESITERPRTSDFEPWSGPESRWTQRIPTDEELNRRLRPQRSQQPNLGNESVASHSDPPDQVIDGSVIAAILRGALIPVQPEEERTRRQQPRQPGPSLDDPTRPAPAAEEDKIMKMECKVCMDQAAARSLVDSANVRTLLYVLLVQHAKVPQAKWRPHQTQSQKGHLYHLSPACQADCEFIALGSSRGMD
ncbi:MAG: hypothetical protein LQ337_002879 [Flavoplaca oasis]|nr:MAG: hypothetical protein LQ337_002879 [Flavoplaca oasis]